MGVITKPYTFSANTTAQSSQVNSDFDTLYSEFNGNITNANISGSAAIAESKIAFSTSGHTHNGVDSALIEQQGLDGWTSADETWTYASATTITVPSDATTKYAVGDRIKLTQSGGVKYFYVVSVAATTLTITGGTLYTLANQAISANYYSHEVSPVGFPQMFTYTPTFTGFSADPSPYTAKFSLIGRECHLFVDTTGGGLGTSNAATFTISLPIAASSSSFVTWGVGQGKDNTSTVLQANAYITTSATTVVLSKDFNAAGNSWTSSGGKGAQFNTVYLI